MERSAIVNLATLPSIAPLKSSDFETIGNNPKRG